MPTAAMSLARSLLVPLLVAGERTRRFGVGDERAEHVAARERDVSALLARENSRTAALWV